MKPGEDTAFYNEAPDQTSGIIGWWNFADGAAEDVSGFGNHGVPAGTKKPWASDGVSPNLDGWPSTWLQFDGSTSNVDIPSFAYSGSTFSASVWINFPANQVNDGRIVSNSHTDSDASGFQIVLGAGGTRLVSFAVGDGTSFVVTSGGTALALGVPHHICATYGGGILQLYVDGVSYSSATGISTMAAGTATLALGWASAYQGDNYAGQIGDVRLFNTTLTAADAYDLYANGLQAQPTEGELPALFAGTSALSATVGATLGSLSSAVTAQTVGSASASSTLAALTLSAAASTGAATATASVTLGTLTSSAVAQAVSQASSAPTLGSLTSSATAQVLARATASVTLGTLTSAATASVAAAAPQIGMQQGFLFKPGAGPTWNVRGRAAFPPAIVTANAVAANTLAALTVTATATALDQASAAVTLAALTTTAVAAALEQAQAAITLGGIGLTSTVSTGSANATVADTLGALTVVATTVAIDQAQAAVILGGVGLSATSAVLDQAQASITLGALSGTATSTAPANATLATTLGPVTLSAVAQNGAGYAGNPTLAALTSSATVTATVQATASITLAAVTSASAAVEVPQASAGVTLGSITVAATAALGAFSGGSVGATLGNLTVTATASAPASASIGATLGQIALHATATVTVQASSAPTLGNLVCAAIVTSTTTSSRAAAIQAKVNSGYGKAARHLGYAFAVYRPSATSEPMAAGNFVQSLNAVFTSRAAGFNFQITSEYKNPLFHGLFDPTNVNVGDYLSAQGHGNYFVASKQDLAPILCVQCNNTITIKRAGCVGGVGAQGYSGSTASSEMPVMTDWPASVIYEARGKNTGAGLPMDELNPYFVILVPALPGVDVRPSDIIYDSDTPSRRYIVTASELSGLGWRIVAQHAVA